MLEPISKIFPYNSITNRMKITCIFKIGKILAQCRWWLEEGVRVGKRNPDLATQLIKGYIRASGSQEPNYILQAHVPLFNRHRFVAHIMDHNTLLKLIVNFVQS